MENKEITIEITDMSFADEPEQEDNKLEILEGNFYEGEYVTVRILDKVYTRKVRNSVKQYGDLYITVNGYAVTFNEFYDEEVRKYMDYSYIIEGRAK